MDNNEQFKPYVPAEKITPEFTVTSCIMGIVLAVVFGAANAYLGLKVGMTVSASIPAAVISMGVIRVILRRDSVLENNLVQTIGSAGESLAAGAIFTLPALFLWAREGMMEKPSILSITVIALVGGFLGILFMVPLRNALIVKEHGTLPYPEGTACAEVLLAGEDGGSSASTVFAGLGISAIFKLVIDGFAIVPSQVTKTFKGYAGAIGTQIYPAVFSVGMICGPRIASFMFAGSLVSWMVIAPLLVMFGGDAVIYPGTESISTMFATGGVSAIWGSYLRYIGAGALAAGGVISLIKSLPQIVTTFRDSMKSLAGGSDVEDIRTNRNINMKIILIAVAALTVLIWLLPAVPVTFIGAILVVIFGFFFATVSSRMVGIVGSSNNPVSGMSIAALLFTSLILKATGDSGVHGMQGAIAIGSIVCIVAAIAGDTSQDLKTGYILGATPVKQQVGELIGVLASAFAIGGVLYLLDSAYGFGTDKLGAPQATLMKMIIEGVMGNNLPWGLVFAGVCLAIVVEILHIPVLPFAIGAYLPIHLNACIMVGGLVRLFLEKTAKSDEQRDERVNKGILYCSGLIAGEGIIGILLAVPAAFGINPAEVLNFSLTGTAGDIGSLITFAVMIALVLKFSMSENKKKA